MVDHPELIDRDRAVLWHPGSTAPEGDAGGFPLHEVVGAVGCRLQLADGREVYDAISSWWCKSLGHGHPRLRAALLAQAECFEHVIIANTTNQPIVGLCERVLRMANGSQTELDRPQPWFSKVFFADSGSTGIEVALKMALQAQAQLGRPQRTRFAALRNGYHGETIGALSVGDCGLYKDTFTSLLFPCLQLGPLPWRSGPEDPLWQDAAPEWPAIERQLDAQAHQLAAIIYEPILQAAGRMRLYSPDLLRRLRGWADAHQVLLIADEIAAGMGRCGAPLASHLAWGHRGQGSNRALPDLAVMSKGLTGGVLPLAMVLCTQTIRDAFAGDGQEGRAFLHSSTFAGNALAVAVAHAVLDEFEHQGIIAQVQRHGAQLRRDVMALAAERPYLRQARGVGMMVAVDLTRNDGAALPTTAHTGWRVCREAVRRGALMRPLGDTVYLMPPLNTAPEDLGRMLSILADSCQAVLA